jgi:hypothetical protein
MARKSAINAVANGVRATLNSASFQSLCAGGVYRGIPLAQKPPFASVGPCTERPWDACGAEYGAEVTVPVRVVTSGQDADGESRAADIIDAVIDLLDLRGSITVPGWQVCEIWWRENTSTIEQWADGTIGYVCTAVFLVQVRQG